MGRLFAGTVALLLLARVVFAADTRFAIIGDYGTDNSPARNVANLVITNLQPEFIVTLGDNNYGTAADYDDVVGKYYARYIGNYSGAHGPGSATNRFFPAIGNHDYYGDAYAAYTSYFTLPGNERYYDVRRGPVHLFVLNSDDHEPDGTSSTSAQAMWLSNRLTVSEAPWKLASPTTRLTRLPDRRPRPAGPMPIGAPTLSSPATLITTNASSTTAFPTS